MQRIEVVALTLLLLLKLHCVQSIFCDEKTVPYRLAISSDGSLQLECVRPSCFGEERYRHPEGLRTVNCYTTPWSTSCVDKQQWFGGTAQNEQKKCCSYEGMKYSTKIAKLVVHPGEEVNGGEVIRFNRQRAIDIISNVEKIEDSPKSNLSYLVTVSRMLCIPDPPEIVNRVTNEFASRLIVAVEKAQAKEFEYKSQEEKFPNTVQKPIISETDVKTSGVENNNEYIEYVGVPDTNVGDKLVEFRPPPLSTHGGGASYSYNHVRPIGLELPPSIQYRTAVQGVESVGDGSEYIDYIEGGTIGPISTGGEGNVAENGGASNGGGGGGGGDECFTSPTGHKCCSRKVEQLLKDLQVQVHKMDENANETSIKREMLAFIKDESEKRFSNCGSGMAFDVLIGNGEFAAETNVPISEPNACKMEISLGRRRVERSVHSRSKRAGKPFHHKFVVLAKQIVSGANSENSKKLSFKAGKESPSDNGGGDGGGGGGAGGGAGGDAGGGGGAGAAAANNAARANAANAAAQANAANAAAQANAANAAAQANAANAAASANAEAAVAAANAASDDKKICFAGDTVVDTDSGPKRMDQLVVGDRVLSADREVTSFSPVTMFIHRIPTLHAEFYKIDTADGASIKLTAKHFIYVADCDGKNPLRRKIFAQDVRLGDCLLKVVDVKSRFEPAHVINITRVHQTGIYSPLTDSGLIVVNDLLASCHSSVSGQNGLHLTFYYWIQKISLWLSPVSGSTIQDHPEQRVDLSSSVQFVLTVFEHLLPELAVIS